MKQHIQEIESALERFPVRTSKQNPEAYIGGGQSKLRYVGLKVPHLRQAAKTGFSFSKQEPTEQAKIYDSIWHNSDCFEVMAMCLDWFYEPKRRSLLVSFWPKLKSWSARIDNWAHSDTLSGIYARILEDQPTVIFPTLKKWNRSPNPWLRRLSLVSLIHYSSARSRVLPCKDILNLVKPQLEYDHYYVQKGVGWTLRECFNVYPKPTFNFMKTNIHKISATAFSSAAEKMTTPQRESLKRLRKQK